MESPLVGANPNAEGRHAAEKSISSFLYARVAEANGQILPRARDFAYSMAVPHGTNPFRIPQAYTATPSSLAQPWSVTEEDWTQPQNQANRCVGLPDGEMLVSISRSPIYARIQYAPNPTNQTAGFLARFPPHPALYGGAGVNFGGMQGDSFQPTMLLISTNSQSHAETPIPLVGWEADPALAYQPHGSFLFAATHKGRRCFPVPAKAAGDNNSLQFTIESIDGNGNPVGAPANIEATFTRYLLVGEEWITFGSVTIVIFANATSATGAFSPSVESLPGVQATNYVALSVLVGPPIAPIMVITPSPG